MTAVTDYLEWDVQTWLRGLVFWEKKAKKSNLFGKKGLEIGSRHGGLSLYFAKNFQAEMTCSDFGGPTSQAKALHLQHGVENQVTYADVNATNIPYDNNTFDFVVFKSVLGALINQEAQEQQRAISEIHRVLKPGGILFFAENLEATFLHRLGRKYLVPWGNSWCYLSLSKVSDSLSEFSDTKLESTGCLAAFIPNRFVSLKKIFSAIDHVLDPLIPAKWHYVVYGYAVK